MVGAKAHHYRIRRGPSLQRAGDPHYSTLLSVHFTFELFDFFLQLVVFGQFAFQEAGGDLGFLLYALWRQLVEVFALVFAFIEVTRLDHAFVDEGVEAIVCFPEADAQLSGQGSLAGVRVLLQLFQQFVAGFVSQQTSIAL